MSFSNFEFPNTNFYNSDLRELIRMYKELSKIYEELNSDSESSLNKYKELKKELDALQTSFNDVETRVNTALEDINTNKAELKSYVNNEIKLSLIEVQKEIDKLMPMVTEHIDRLQESIDNTNGYVDNRVTHLTEKVDAELNKHLEDVNEIKLAYSDYVDNLFDKINTRINNIQIDQTIVVDPVDGVLKPTNQALNSMYDALTYWSLTANEYDSVSMSAETQKELEVSAYLLDNVSRWYYIEKPNIFKICQDKFNKLTTYLNRELDKIKVMVRAEELHDLIINRTTTYSPISGKMVQVKDLFSEIVSLLSVNASSAVEFERADLTASEYDNLLLSAYEFDWNSKNYI